MTSLVVASILGLATPASACSMGAPPNIADLMPGVPLVDGHPDSEVVGVYEFEYLARSPRLLISGPRAVTMVTRYWGEPPAHLGLEMTGDDAGLWSTSSCGNTTQPAGEVSYWYTDQLSIARHDWGRTWLTLGGTDGPIDTAQEAMLEARFGPPVVMDITFGNHATARFQLWKWHLLGIAMIGSSVVILRRLRRRRPSTGAG